MMNHTRITVLANRLAFLLAAVLIAGAGLTSFPEAQKARV